VATTSINAFDSIHAAAPASFLLIAGCLVFLIGTFSVRVEPTIARDRWGWVSLLLLAVAAILSESSAALAPIQTLALFREDSLTLSLERLTLLGGFLLVLIGWSSVPPTRLSEYYGCLHILLSGLMYLAAANDLTTLFLSLELISIPAYVLLGIVRTDPPGREATFKYFALSAFSSGIFVFGLSLLYGACGSTDLQAVHTALRSTSSPVVQAGWIMLLMGMSFRMTAVPFHFYAPDVFEGTSMPLASLLSFLPKLAGFGTLLRLLVDGTLDGGVARVVVMPMVLLGLLSMCVGNALALRQSSIRRMLAYSSVAHTGYMLVGLAALVEMGTSPQPVIFYLAAYAAMTLGSFAVLESVAGSKPGAEALADLRGLSRRAPWRAFCLTIFMLSLVGLPLTAGFWAKLQILVAMVQQGSTLSLAAAMITGINAAVAAVYYLPVVVTLFESTPNLPNNLESRPGADWAATISTAFLLVGFFAPFVLTGR
jgi:NADH-quinone oxidoreductase subunit N